MPTHADPDPQNWRIYPGILLGGLESTVLSGACASASQRLLLKTVLPPFVGEGFLSPSPDFVPDTVQHNR